MIDSARSPRTQNEDAVMLLFWPWTFCQNCLGWISTKRSEISLSQFFHSICISSDRDIARKQEIKFLFPTTFNRPMDKKCRNRKKLRYRKLWGCMKMYETQKSIKVSDLSPPLFYGFWRSSIPNFLCIFPTLLKSYPIHVWSSFPFKSEFNAHLLLNRSALIQAVKLNYMKAGEIMFKTQLSFTWDVSIDSNDKFVNLFLLPVCC